jgi:hypothetical protein
LKVVRPTSAYLISTILASLFYVVWFVFFFMRQIVSTEVSLIFKVGFAFFFCLTSGFGLALALMSLPWVAVVWGYRRLRSWGPLYFAGIGALLIFVIGCATSSLSWKPLFIEDQTFFEGVIIAAERQGIILLLAGAFFGFIYWFLRYSDGLIENATRPSA